MISRTCGAPAIDEDSERPRPDTRMRRLVLKSVLVTIISGLSAAAVAEPSSGLPRPRVAVAQIGEFHVAKTLGELGPDVVIKAAAQGVRDVCFELTTNTFRGATSCEHPAVSTPVGVCADMTLDRALARMVVCNTSDQTVDVVELSSSPCRTSECLKADARQLNATHVLIVQGKSSDFGLDVAMDLIDLLSGSVQSKHYRDYFQQNERDDTAIVPRTGPQIIGIVHGMARDLVQSSMREALAPRTASTAAPPAPPPPAVPTTPAVPIAPQNPRPLPTWVGWTALSAGVVAVVGGAVLWSLDGKPRCSDTSNGDLCPETWRTTRAAVPLVVGGALVGGFGGWALYRSPRGGEAMVAALPGGVSLFGRF
jgi:hypothetical protein